MKGPIENVGREGPSAIGRPYISSCLQVGKIYMLVLVDVDVGRALIF